MDELQAGNKATWRNINKLIYADETTLMAESEEELKSFLMRVKEESENTGLKLEKGYVRAVYGHPAYLTSMQNTLSEMLGWINHKL